jgi:outer membrane murein-binding lipoprotein Lpp
VPEVIPEIASPHPRGSVAWYADEIARKEAALLSNENHIRFLELQIIEQEATDLTTLKMRKAEATSANDLRQEIARLRTEKMNAETATVKVAKSQAALTRDRITALEGDN